MYTPGFAPPELYVKNGSLGPWTDIYSIGAAMFSSMIGAPPPPVEQRSKIDKVDGYLAKLEGLYSPELIKVVRWCLMLDPLARPPSVFTLQKALQEALGLASQNSATATTQALSRQEALERIRQEVSLYGIRIDVAEELSRLAAHLNETRQILKKGGQVGKRLDFMMQELNREANTLGAKASVKELSDASMALKLLIEQMREQVQNLE